MTIKSMVNPYSRVEFVLVKTICGHHMWLLSYYMVAVPLFEVSYALSLSNLKFMTIVYCIECIVTAIVFSLTSNILVAADLSI